MSKKNNEKNLSPSLVEFICCELDKVNQQQAKQTLYHLLLDKYQVPSSHSLRLNADYGLTPEQLVSRLHALGFKKCSTPVKSRIH